MSGYERFWRMENEDRRTNRKGPHYHGIRRQNKSFTSASCLIKRRKSPSSLLLDVYHPTWIAYSVYVWAIKMAWEEARNPGSWMFIRDILELSASDKPIHSKSMILPCVSRTVRRWSNPSVSPDYYAFSAPAWLSSKPSTMSQKMISIKTFTQHPSLAYSSLSKSPNTPSLS